MVNNMSAAICKAVPNRHFVCFVCTCIIVIDINIILFVHFYFELYT